MFNKNITSVKGVGKKYSELFFQNGINTIEDLIMYFPRGYDYINLNSGKCVFEGIVSEILKDVIVRKNLIITTIKMRNENQKFAKLVYFNKPYMKHSFSWK